MFDALAFGPWMWFAAGLVLIGIEIAAPGLFMLWLGLAAGATGLMLLAVPLPWQAQLALFAGFAIAAVFLGRRFSPRPDAVGDAALLNQRQAALIGRTVLLAAPIRGGVGQAKIDDSVWRVVGEDLDAGAPVRIVAVDGATLRVEPARQGG
jgi:hypothetical protein